MASENETVQGLTVELWPIYELKDDKWRPCANIVVRYNNEIIDLKDTNFDYYFDQHPVRRFRDVTDLKTGAHNFKCVVTYKGETKISSVDAYFNELTQSECIPNTPIVPEVPDVPPTSEPDEPTEPTTPVETKAKLPDYIKYPYLARGSFNPKTADIGRTYYTQWIKIVPTEEEWANKAVDLYNHLGNNRFNIAESSNGPIYKGIWYGNKGHVMWVDRDRDPDDWNIIYIPRPEDEYGPSDVTWEFLMVMLSRKYYIRKIADKDVVVGYTFNTNGTRCYLGNIPNDKILPSIEHIGPVIRHSSGHDPEEFIIGLAVKPLLPHAIEIQHKSTVDSRTTSRGKRFYGIHSHKWCRPLSIYPPLSFRENSGYHTTYDIDHDTDDDYYLLAIYNVFRNHHIFRFRYRTQKRVVGPWSYFYWNQKEQMFYKIK